jgi:hypothetical protein
VNPAARVEHLPDLVPEDAWTVIDVEFEAVGMRLERHRRAPRPAAGVAVDEAQRHPATPGDCPDQHPARNAMDDFAELDALN